MSYYSLNIRVGRYFRYVGFGLYGNKMYLDSLHPIVGLHNYIF